MREVHPHFECIYESNMIDVLRLYGAKVTAEKFVVILSEERSGSEWLCQLMGRTQLLGRPSEYFNWIWFRRFIPDYPSDVSSQIEVIKSISVTPNGIGGIKLHAQHFDAIKSQLKLFDILAPVLFIRLHRRDKLRQAISLVRARQTKAYHYFTPREAMEKYDGDHISRTIDELLTINGRWLRFLSCNGLDYIDITYENLVSDPINEISKIATFAGVDLKVQSHHYSCNSLKTQRDDITELWRNQYLHEFKNLDHFN